MKVDKVKSGSWIRGRHFYVEIQQAETTQLLNIFPRNQLLQLMF